MKFYTNVYRYGRNIRYIGYENGLKVQRLVPFEPTLYVKSNKLQTGYQSIDGTKVEPIQFSDMAEGTTFVKSHANISGFGVYGQTNFATQYVNEKFPGNIEWDRDLINVTSIDIECKSESGFPYPEQADQEVTAICCKNNIDKIFHVFGCGKYTVEKPNVNYVRCIDEQELLTRYVAHMSDVDIITGWNVNEFDIPYLVNRIEKVCGKEVMKRLSPWGDVKDDTPKKSTGFFEPKLQYKLGGVVIMDYLALFKKFAHEYGAQESYKLDNIANVVLGDSKLSFDEYSDLNELYEKDYQKFINYNIKDVDIVDRLDDKLDLISLALTMAYNSGSNYGDVFGTVAIWDTIIYRDLSLMNVVIPPKVDTDSGTYPGGYVKEPQVGKHDWVCSFDLNSLYPSIIMQYNMSPETIISGITPGVNVDSFMDGRVQNNMEGTALAINGTRYKTAEHGVFPRIIEGMYNNRVGFKQAMLKAQQDMESIAKDDVQGRYDVERRINIAKNNQMSIKLLLNSLYGAMGNKWFRYYDRNIAEAITLTGQATIKYAEKALNGYLQGVLKTEKDYIVAIDTDSVYVQLGDLVDLVKPKNPVKFLDRVCEEQLEVVLKDCYADLYARLGGRTNKMVMAREAIADRGIWTAKKRYILNVHNNEGVQYAEPKLKIMGIEAVKSSTPMICRNSLKAIFKTIISKSEEEVQKEIAQFKVKFNKANPEEVAFPRGVNGIDKWTTKGSGGIYEKGTPIHVRGAILHNHHTTPVNTTKIESGDKIKFTYLTQPNPIRENVISFIDYLPDELGLASYVDYNTQFDKTFLSVITPILDAVGWKVEKEVSIEDFF